MSIVITLLTWPLSCQEWRCFIILVTWHNSPVTKAGLEAYFNKDREAHDSKKLGKCVLLTTNS